MNEIEELYMQTLKGDTTLDLLISSVCLTTTDQVFLTHSKTSKLWLSYQQMLGVVRELIKADRTRSWVMHLHDIADCLPIFAAAGHANYLKSTYLYFHSMQTLEQDHPSVFHRFMNGLHVFRHTDQYWAGLGCGLVIKQALMRSLKTTGGLTRGSGMSNHQRALWTMSVPVSSTYSEAMQNFTGQRATGSRVRRDNKHLEKIADKLQAFSPFAAEASLHNIITGVNTNEDVNVYDLFTIGKETLAKMEGQLVFSFSYRRNRKAKNLASASTIRIAKTRAIDSALLFQRFLVVSQTAELSLDKIMSYKLSPYPQALFEAKHVLWKTDKAKLMHALKTHVTAISNEAVLETAPEAEHNVFDGGSLLRRLKWSDGRTYTSIANDYAAFTVKHYGKATVVFDGYSVGPSTKDNTHQRWGQNRES